MKKIFVPAIFAIIFACPVFADPKTFDIDVKFEAIDTNRDGSLSKDEIMAYHAMRFDAKDSDNNGKISKKEYRSFHKEHNWNIEKQALADE